MSIRVSVLLVLCVAMLPLRTLCSHVRGGYIEIVSVHMLTVQFRVFGIRDTDSSILIGGGKLLFSDGEEKSGPFEASSSRRLADGYELLMFEFEHTFPAAGSHWIGYEENSRNYGVRNVSGSGATNFYCSTSFTLDPFIQNQFPVITPEFVLNGFTKQVFNSAISVADPDGDLVSYSFATPRQAPSKFVSGYQFPWEQSFYSSFETGSSSGGRATHHLDRVTGNLRWDAPGNYGDYSVVIEIAEKRFLHDTWITLSKILVDVNYLIYNEKPEADELEADFEWNLCHSDPPYELEVKVNSPAKLYVDAPFLVQEDGTPTFSMNGLQIEANTTFSLIPNPNFQKSGFYHGYVHLISGMRSARYTILYATDCDLLNSFELITSSENQFVSRRLFSQSNHRDSSFFRCQSALVQDS